VIWLMTEIAEDSTAHNSDLFLQVDARVLENSVPKTPGNEALLSRLSHSGARVESKEIAKVYEVIEEVWDRAQGSIAEGLIKSGELPRDTSLKARQLARDLRRALKTDPFMVSLDEILGFLTLVRERGGGIVVVS
jgi:hypothetical protein